MKVLYSYRGLPPRKCVVVLPDGNGGYEVHPLADTAVAIHEFLYHLLGFEVT